MVAKLKKTHIFQPVVNLAVQETNRNEDFMIFMQLLDTVEILEAILLWFLNLLALSNLRAGAVRAFLPSCFRPFGAVFTSSNYPPPPVTGHVIELLSKSK